MESWIYVLSFYVVSALALAGGLGVLLLRNLFHNGLCLVLALFAVAGLFVLLGAEFIAGVQVLIYVGAIAVLIMFAVMLTERIAAKRVPRFSRSFALGIAAAGAVLILAVAVGRYGRFGTLSPPPLSDVIPALAARLLTAQLLPFEVVSLLLLGALIGAIVVARKEEPR